MTIIYTWVLDNTEYTVDATGLPVTIQKAHWNCKGEEGAAVFTVPGGTNMFLSAATATESDVIEEVKRLNPKVEEDIALQINLSGTNTLSLGKPWAAQFPNWVPDLAYSIDDSVEYDLKGFKCIQSHTSLPNWTPPVTPALWSTIQDDTGPGPIPWIAGEDLLTGEVRVYNEILYEVVQGHTTQVGWEPPNVPALWKVVI